MKINERIFNELKRVYNGADFENVDDPDAADEILLTMAKRKIGPTEADHLEMAILDEYRDIIQVYSVDMDSLLYQSLANYFGGIDGVMANLRNAVRYSADALSIHEEIWFEAGIGYDIISSDLLNGSPDGQEKQKFLDFINSHD